jgi:hypothetical protein
MNVLERKFELAGDGHCVPAALTWMFGWPEIPKEGLAMPAEVSFLEADLACRILTKGDFGLLNVFTVPHVGGQFASTAKFNSILVSHNIGHSEGSFSRWLMGYVESKQVGNEFIEVHHMVAVLVDLIGRKFVVLNPKAHIKEPQVFTSLDALFQRYSKIWTMQMVYGVNIAPSHPTENDLGHVFQLSKELEIETPDFADLPHIFEQKGEAKEVEIVITHSEVKDETPTPKSERGRPKKRK